jgi:hypothetical protein
MALAALPASSRAAEPAWLAGDFHVHTCYSHDGYCVTDDDNTGPDEFYTASGTVTERFAEGAARGLDFLAITDHNDVRSQADAGFGAFGLVGVPAYEHSLHGHSQMLGATHLFDEGDSSDAAVQAMADALRAEGGLFQTNHPTSALLDPIDDCTEFENLDWGYGTEIVPDSLEVWNIWHAWQPPAPASNSNDDAEVFWECFLNEGHRVAATGGSDSHWLSTAAVQGPGNPTTWVLSDEASAAGILGGVRNGRTAISMLPPHEGGLPLLLSADAADGALQGDTVAAATPMHVSNAFLPGMVRIRTNQGQMLEAPIAPGLTVDFTPPAGTTWVRAMVVTVHPMLRAICPIDDQTTYCRNRWVVASITSPIYIG